MAVASQPGKVSEEHKKSLSTTFKTLNITKIKVENDSDDSDRHLAKEGSIRGEKMELSAQYKPSLQDRNTAFEADIAMPVRLQSTMKKTSGASNRHLQTAACTEQDNGLLACVLVGYPAEDVSTVLLDCPVDVSDVSECGSCAIVVTADDSLPQCSSCYICSDSNVAFDCSNIADGECSEMDCDGNCIGAPTPPVSSASMSKLEILSIAATAIAGFGLS